MTQDKFVRRPGSGSDWSDESSEWSGESSEWSEQSKSDSMNNEIGSPQKKKHRKVTVNEDGSITKVHKKKTKKSKKDQPASHESII